ncbi:MAG: hypothetical protein KAR06_07460, partial [Deltaproteobacteria bacterium]|nr:hypothetical protein [Deltaproteobacteria bacterium]
MGNFDHVIEDAYNRSYMPFLKAMSKSPEFKFTLHNSGFLLKWIEKNKPEYIELAKALVKRGQLEILGGGMYEPILSVLYERDALGQIELLSNYIEGLFGVRPKGVWLAE